MSDKTLNREEVFLLSKFQKFQEPREFKTEFWQSVIKKSINKIIDNFLENGFLEKADLQTVLAHKCKMDELKRRLKNKNLKTSGKKENLIERLLDCAHNELQKEYATVNLYRCSEVGMTLVNQFIEGENRRREESEHIVINELKERNFVKAIREVVKFEASEIIPRGMGIDWKNYNLEQIDVETLTNIFKSKPKILSDVDDDKLEALRIGASMMHLYGAVAADKWFPTNLETKSRFDNNTAARMLLFHTEFLREKNDINNSIKSGIATIKQIAIIASNDSCEECKAMANKKYTLNNIPELPYEKCSCDLGCRCSISPVFD